MRNYLRNFALLLFLSILTAIVYGQQTLPSRGGASKIVNGSGSLLFEVDSNGNATITPSGGAIAVVGTVTPSVKTGTGAAVLSTLPTITNLVTAGYRTLVDAASITNDVSLGSQAQVVLQGNRTLLAPSNGVDGQEILIDILQDSVGNRTLAFATNYIFSATIASPTVNTNSYYHCMIRFVGRSTNNVWRVLSLSNGAL